MAIKKKILFSSIKYDPKLNHREIDLAHVAALRKSIKDDGMWDMLEVTPVTEASDDATPETVNKVTKGAHRYHALCELRDSVDPKDIAAFDKEAPGGKIEVKIAEGDFETLHTRGVKDNTYRKALTDADKYAEAKRLTVNGKDQYEVAEILNVQQPRVAELLSFDKVVTAGHELWRAGVLSNADMVKFASLDAEAQEEALKGFEGAAKALAAGGDSKQAKQAKATARKELKKTAATKGNKREYANAGKPTRQKLASYVPQITVKAISAKSADERAFYNAFAAAFKVINGETPFEKISFDKTYVTKTDASAAQKILDEAAAKAAAKLEKEKAAKEKASKAAKKAAKAEKPKKAPAKKAAKKATKAKRGVAEVSSKVTQGPKKPAKKAAAKKAAKKAK